MHTAWKTLAIAAGIACSAGSRPASAQTGFEGVTTFVTHREDGSVDTTVQTTKGNMMRLEGMGGHSGYAMIFNGTDHSHTMMMADKKMYMHTTEDQELAQMSRIKGQVKDTSSMGDFHIAPTGKTETVAGASCQDYHGTGTYDGKTQDVTVCVAQGVGFQLGQMMSDRMLRSSNPRMAQQYQMMKAMLGENRGVVKVTEIKDGKPVVSLEMVKVERKPIADAAFAPPPEYSEFKMPAGMKQP